ncbi:type II CAAX endopeptidase family protein [Mycoplasmatota bacterium WC44]
MKFSRSEGAWVFFGYLVGFLGLQLIIGTMFGLYYQLKHGVTVPMDVIMQFGAIVTLITTIIVYVLFVIVLRKRLTVNLRQIFSNKKLILVIFVGFIIAYCINIGYGITYNLLGVDGKSENQELLESLINSFPLLMLIPTAFLVPLIEEILFRGVILEFFEKRLGLLMGVLISSIFFGLMHVTDSASLIFLPIYATLGGLFAALYIKYDRNILVPIGVHLLNNLVSVLLIMFI